MKKIFILTALFAAVIGSAVGQTEIRKLHHLRINHLHIYPQKYPWQQIFLNQLQLLYIQLMQKMAKRIKVIKCPQCGSTKAKELRTDHYQCKNCYTEFFIWSEENRGKEIHDSQLANFMSVWPVREGPARGG